VRPIEEVADRAGIARERVEPYGRFKAKIRGHEDMQPRGRLVAVTAINPTPHGEGKTVTAIGLTDALVRIGTRAMATLRQPSLGPIFGVKGGATGSGGARLVPASEINLHFTGDFHAIASAQNLFAAMTDNHRFHGNALGIDVVHARRAIDMNDRSLRGTFDIVAASETMAVLALARDRADLEARLGRMIAGARADGTLLTAADLRAHGAMSALLRDAIAPNLVQTLEGNAVLVHTGPFANVATGNSSVIADRVALAHAEVVVTESGFGTDCGFEKLVDLKCRDLPWGPAVAVIVVTTRAVKFHGAGDLRAGFANVEKHIENVRLFGVEPVIAINVFDDDTEGDLAALEDAARACGAWFARSDVHARGGEGGELLARIVLTALAHAERAAPIYATSAPLDQKIETIATRVYGASSVAFTDAARAELDAIGRTHGELPVCIAKTPASLSHDPKLLARPRDFVFPIDHARLYAGAGYVLALAGNILTMPGLPAKPGAENIGLDASGEVFGI
jgi:formate--tetrahydrofolate ligase